MKRHTHISAALSIALAGIVNAQSPTYAACRQADSDAFALSAGNSMFELPGVATDFILAGGGQLSERSNGTAHLSALIRRQSEIDRLFLVDVELGGRVQSGSLNFPPAGALAPGLLPGAYTPLGPVNPTTFHYYTTGTGMLRGHGAYAGATVSLQLSAPLQVGTGASNRNVGPGLACTFTVQVLTQPSFLVLQPIDEARLLVTTAPSQAQCTSHVDRDDAMSAGPERAALIMPGLGTDFVFIPAGEFTEFQNGTATLNGTLRRETDFDDRWTVSLTLTGRIDPGDGNYPPPAGPVLGLLASAYVAGGGIVDPDTFRYYGAATGQLVGGGNNAGGVVDVQATRPVQVGVGADQGNHFFGLYAELQPALGSHANSHTLALGGNGTLRANVDTMCILPYPNQTPGLHIVLDNVGGTPGQITGQNLAWIEQMTIGAELITNNPRNWTQGYLDVKSSSLVEVYAPQGMTPGTYTTRVYTRAIAGGFRQMTLNVPGTPRCATAPDRFTGESQDIFVSHGNLPAPQIGGLFYSFSNGPTPVPGIVNLDIGGFGSDLNFVGLLFPDFTTRAAAYHVPALPATIAGATIYFQGAFVDGFTIALPATPTDVDSTHYF